MARISLKCACSWSFFVPDTTQNWQVTCPSCGQGVPIPGRSPGRPVLSPGMLAAENQRKQKNVMLLVGVVAAIVVVGGVLVVVLNSGRSPTQDEFNDRESRTSEGAKALEKNALGAGRGFIPPAGDLPPAAAPPPPAAPPAAPKGIPFEEQVQLKNRITSLVREANMAGIVSECLRFRGIEEGSRQMLQVMVERTQHVDKALARLAEGGEAATVEPRMVPGDRILRLGAQDISTGTNTAASAALDEWLRKFRGGLLLQECLVQRGTQKVMLHFNFPEETKELLQLVRAPGVLPPVVTGPGDTLPNPGTGVMDLPDSVLKQLTDRLAAIPAGYRQLMPAPDRTRMEGLLQKRRGTPEDLDFVNTLLTGDAIGRYEQEHALFRAKVAEIEPKVGQAVAVDVITRKNGSTLEGTIEEETEEYVKLKARLGSVKVPRADIRKVDKNKGAGVEFPEKLKAAQGKVDALSALLTWCKEKNLRLEKEYVGYLILLLDPTHDKARTELNITRPGGGKPGGAVPPPGQQPFSGAALPPPVPPGSAAYDDFVVHRVDELATAVTAKYSTFPEVVSEMRKMTEGLKYGAQSIPPEKSAKGAAHIANPLTFRPAELTTKAAIEVGTWWSALNAAERLEFAKFFGLWCAYARFSGRYGN